MRTLGDQQKNIRQDMPIQDKYVGCSACTTNQSISELRYVIAGFWVLCHRPSTFIVALSEIVATSHLIRRISVIEILSLFM
jgi:hypothetical protein